MDVLTFETCWAVNSEIIKQVTSSLSIFIQLSSDRQLVDAWPIFVPRRIQQTCKGKRWLQCDLQCVSSWIEHSKNPPCWMRISAYMELSQIP